VYIRKSTAVWLFSEGERLSSDRLFRERSTQPFNTNKSKKSTEVQSQDLPYVSEYINVSDM
jgi:hypothetical protein